MPRCPICGKSNYVIENGMDGFYCGDCCYKFIANFFTVCGFACSNSQLSSNLLFDTKEEPGHHNGDPAGGG